PAAIATESCENYRRCLQSRNLMRYREDFIIDGQRIVTDTTLIPTRDANQSYTRIIGLAQNLTETVIAQEKLEQAVQRAQKASQIKAALLSGLSHDLRTPLHALLGLTELMQKDSAAGANPEFMARLASAANEILLSVGVLLDYSDLVTDDAHRTTDTILLPRILNAVRPQLAVMENKTRRRLDWLLAEGTTEPLQSDSSLFTRLLVHFGSVGLLLFSDAVLPVAITVEQNGSREAGVQICMRGRTNASALSAPADYNEPALFSNLQPQDRNHSSLSVAILHLIIEALGGSVSLEPDADGRAQLLCRLQVGHIHEPASISRSDSRSAAGRSTGLHALVVDDIEVNRIVLARMLEYLDISFDLCSNGSQAVLAVQQRPYDIILMDLHMPVMDGTRAASQILTECESTPVPIVAMSADTTRQTREQSLAAGFQDFITKPFDLGALQKVLADHTGYTLE
ncbi:MAG: response regulator, partial [Leptospiraceae bacterium]|nr:response regulator [Leptospiraceae bacterium]